MEEEIWREFPIDAVEHENFYRIEVSNTGRVKTFNSHFPEGRINNCGDQGGYRILRISLYKKRSPKVAKKIAEFNEQLFAVQELIYSIRQNDFPQAQKNNMLESEQQRKEKIIQDRKKYIKRTDKKRIQYLAFLVHRMVAEVFLQKPRDGEVVIHKDFNKLNNRPENLEWVTREKAYDRYKDNPALQAALEKQRQEKKKGERTWSKLTTSDVLYIKEKLNQGKTLRELATKFGVSDMQIHRIKTGENWGKLKTLQQLKKEQKPFKTEK